MVELCRPDRVYWCDGSKPEKEALTAKAVNEGSDPAESGKAARLLLSSFASRRCARRASTFVCTENEEEAVDQPGFDLN